MGEAALKEEKTEEKKMAEIVEIELARKKFNAAKKTLASLKANKKANGDPNGNYEKPIKAAKSRLKNAKAKLNESMKKNGLSFFQRNKDLIAGITTVGILILAGFIIIATKDKIDEDSPESNTDTM